MSKKRSDSFSHQRGTNGARGLDWCLPPNQGKMRSSIGDLTTPPPPHSHVQSWGPSRGALVCLLQGPHPSALTQAEILSWCRRRLQGKQWIWCQVPSLSSLWKCVLGARHRDGVESCMGSPLMLWLYRTLCRTVSLRMLPVFCRGSHSYKTRILHTGFSWAHSCELVWIPHLPWLGYLRSFTPLLQARMHSRGQGCGDKSLSVTEFMVLTKMYFCFAL